jgi:hypothetical protein
MKKHDFLRLSVLAGILNPSTLVLGSDDKALFVFAASIQ